MSTFQNQNETQSQNQREKEKELAEKIKNGTRKQIAVTPSPFPALMELTCLSSTDICRMINSLMNSLFVNYQGSDISVTNTRQIVTTLFFTDKGQKAEPSIGKYNSVINIVRNNKDSIAAINNLISSNRKTYELSEEAKELLVDVIPNNFINYNTGKVNWNACMRETSIRNNFTAQQTVYLQVMVDLNKVLKLVYGSSTDNGGYYVYNIPNLKPINPVVTPNGSVESKWMLTLQRTNTKDLQDIASDMGISFGGDNPLGIVTDVM